MNFRAIINLFSILVLFFSFSYVFPILVSIVFNDNSLYLFLPAFILVSILGLIGFLLTKGVQRDLSSKDGFVIIVMFWLVLHIFYHVKLDFEILLSRARLIVNFGYFVLIYHIFLKI